MFVPTPHVSQHVNDGKKRRVGKRLNSSACNSGCAVGTRALSPERLVFKSRGELGPDDVSSSESLSRPFRLHRWGFACSWYCQMSRICYRTTLEPMTIRCLSFTREHDNACERAISYLRKLLGIRRCTTASRRDHQRYSTWSCLIPNPR